MTDSIISQLKTYIIQDILRQPDRDLHLDELLLSSGLVDSFHLVDLGLFIEDTFGVQIDDTELNADTFDTLEQLATFIQERQ